MEVTQNSSNYYRCIAGVISGALLYIREDFHEVDRKAWLQV